MMLLMMFYNLKVLFMKKFTIQCGNWRMALLFMSVCCFGAVACQTQKADGRHESLRAKVPEKETVFTSVDLKKEVSMIVRERFGEDKEFELKGGVFAYGSENEFVFLSEYETEDGIKGNYAKAPMDVNYVAHGKILLKMGQGTPGTTTLYFWCKPEENCPYGGLLEWRDSVIVSPCRECVLVVGRYDERNLKP